jgi:hypothetical protein
METILQPAKMDLVFSWCWVQEILLERQRTYFEDSIFVGLRVCLNMAARKKIVAKLLRGN